jgi:hypothetical protein
MKDGALPLSVMDFMWEEIKGISMNPQKTCGFTSYLMFIIEDVTDRSFPKEASTCLSGQTPTRSL